MGTPEFACAPLAALAASHHKVLAVVTGPDKPVGRGRQLTPTAVKLTAERLGLSIYQPENLKDELFIKEMADLKADLFVVIAFRILPKKLYAVPKLGSINIHASLLPRYRGAAPINHALLNGEKETGLSSFFLIDKVDQGNLIHQTKTDILADENFTSLYRRLSQMAGSFLLETLDLIKTPGFAPKQQDELQATPAPKIRPEDLLINWNRPARQIHNHIRAYSEMPGAFCHLGDMQIKILGARRVGTSTVARLDPGQIVIIGKQILVGTADDPLEIISLQPQGKKVLDSASFINGYRNLIAQGFSARRKEVNI